MLLLCTLPSLCRCSRRPWCWVPSAVTLVAVFLPPDVHIQERERGRIVAAIRVTERGLPVHRRIIGHPSSRVPASRPRNVGGSTLCRNRTPFFVMLPVSSRGVEIEVAGVDGPWPRTLAPSVAAPAERQTGQALPLPTKPARSVPLKLFAPSATPGGTRSSADPSQKGGAVCAARYWRPSWRRCSAPSAYAKRKPTM